MIKLFTKEEFENSKSNIKLPLQCYVCNKSFYIRKSTIEFESKNIHRERLKFCSRKCHQILNHPNLSIDVECLKCKKHFLKKKAQYIKSSNHFCSKSCAASYNNTHKTKGTRVSKLEVWLSEQLTLLYPNLEIHYNRKDAINSELDIYIPSLKLAFELNGIFHYEPIYGPDKLQQIQNNDKHKFKSCLEQNISLCIIDSSDLKYFKPVKVKKYLDIITNIINSKNDC